MSEIERILTDSLEKIDRELSDLHSRVSALEEIVSEGLENTASSLKATVKRNEELSDSLTSIKREKSSQGSNIEELAAIVSEVAASHLELSTWVQKNLVPLVGEAKVRRRKFKPIGD